MLKTILVGGLALSILCFLLAQNGSRRFNKNNGSGYPSTKYGPPEVDNNFPANDSSSVTTEPYFRIVLSKRINMTSGTPKTTTEILEYYNDVDNDDYNDTVDYHQNFPLFQNLNETELRRLLIPNEFTKTNFETTTIPIQNSTNLLHPKGVASTLPPSPSPMIFFPLNATHASKYLYENVTEVKTTPMQPSTSTAFEYHERATTSTTTTPSSTTPQDTSKFTFQFTTIKAFTTAESESTIVSTLRKDHNFETVTEFQINSQTRLSSTPKTPSSTYLYENITADNPTKQVVTETTLINNGLRYDVVTEGFNQTWNQFILQPQIPDAGLSYLPPPSASLSIPELKSQRINTEPNLEPNKALNINRVAFGRNATQPSRLYLPPNLK